MAKRKRIAKRKLKIQRFLNKNPNATTKEIVSATGTVNSYAHIVRKEWLEEQQESPASKLVAGIVENIQSVVPEKPVEMTPTEIKEQHNQMLSLVRAGKRPLTQNQIKTIDAAIALMNNHHTQYVDGVAFGYNPIRVEDVIELFNVLHDLKTQFNFRD